MKIKFIGVGNIATKKAKTSTLIDDILFDAGNGIMDQLDRLYVSLEDINYLVISHFHSDHFLDVIDILYTRRLRGIKNKLVIIGPKTLREKVRQILCVCFSNSKEDNQDDMEEKFNVEFIELGDNEIYQINDKTLRAIKLEHTNCIYANGYVIDEKLAYLVDSNLCDNFKKACKESKYIIADVTGLESNDYHVGLKEYLEIAKENKDNIYYAVHRGDYSIEGIDIINFPEAGDEIEIN